MNDGACGAGADAAGCAGVAVPMNPPGAGKVGIGETDSVAEVAAAVDAVAGAVVAKAPGALPVAASAPPNAAGAAAAIVLVGASAPEDGAGTTAAAATGAVPGAACAAPFDVAGMPGDQASGVRLASAAEGVADAVDVAANVLPAGALDAAAGDPGACCVLCAGCDAIALNVVPVDARAVVAATAGAVADDGDVAGPAAFIAGVRADTVAAMPGAAAEDWAAVTTEAPFATVGADVVAEADGCAVGWAAALVECVWAGAGVIVAEPAPVAPSADDAAAGAWLLETYEVAVAPAGAASSAGATDATDAGGCDGDQAAVLVTAGDDGVVAAGVLFDAFAGVGAAAPGAVPTRDDAEVAAIACAAAEGSADNGFDHDADAVTLTGAGSAVAKVDAADALGIARCVSAGDGAVSPACVVAACRAVPVAASAGAMFDVSAAVGIAAATGVASATRDVGAAAIDEAGRGAVGAACCSGFTTSRAASVSCFVSTDTAVPTDGADRDSA